MTKQRRAFVARILLAALLFAQGALAATVCTMPERSAAQAIASTSTPPCHQAMPEERNSNLCLVDCASELQSLDKPPLVVHGLPSSPVLVVRMFERTDRRAAMRVVATETIVSGAPPPRILFQSFLI